MALSRKARSRLNTLIKYMANLKVRGHFKMRHWAAHNGKVATIDVHGIAKAGKVEQKHLLECGMSACAAGWACTVPSFRRAGLMMTADKGRFYGSPNLRPVYQGDEHFDAITAFFDIPEKKARRLFGYTLDVKSPAQWAKRAKAIVREWEKA